MSSNEKLISLIFKNTSKYLNSLGINLSEEDLRKNVKTHKKSKLVIISDYKKFISICKTHKFPYFSFNDTHDWSGPAIKCDTNFDYESFFKLKIHVIRSDDFIIIRPFKKCKNNIDYPINYINNCKLMNSSLIPFESHSDTESDNEIHTDEWYHQGTKYLLNPDNNNLYSFSTNEFIGKKIDEFTIDFDACEKN